MTTGHDVTVNSYAAAREALRHRELRQALYDEGDVVMADVLVNLHGSAHRDRRRLENRLFRRATNLRYELELFPPVVADTLKPHVESGRGELVSLSHQMMMNLAAVTAGVDRPDGTAAGSDRLYQLMMLFIEGATLAHYSGDRAAKRAEVAAALDEFDGVFLAPSIQRRRDALARMASGDLDEHDLPGDILTVLLRNLDHLELPHDVVVRETAFYLLAGAHTSATAFVRTLDAVFALDATAPDDADQARDDLEFLQCCVHETIRLQPSSPVAMRWAMADVELADGTRLARGDRVVIDLMAANRDPQVFGDDADRFDPRRVAHDGAAPWGLSFGSGMHACIGQELAAGGEVVRPGGNRTSAADGLAGLGGGRAGPDRLYGLVPVAVRAVLDAGAEPDPENSPVPDPDSARGYWARYPVVFEVSP